MDGNLPEAREQNVPEDELTRLLPGLSRAVVAATRSVRHLPTLTESQVALIRELVECGPLTPAQVASQLRLSRPTISNLVREAESKDLVERRPATLDRRSVFILPTAHARALLESFGVGRAEVVTRALDEASVDDRKKLIAALPALSRLEDRLLSIAQEGAVKT